MNDHTVGNGLRAVPRMAFDVRRASTIGAVAFCVAVVGRSASAQESVPEAPPDEPERRLFTGQVVFLEDALAGSDVETYPETGRHVVLKTGDGELIPILADWRGRAFYQDEKLRDRKVELIGFFREGLPYLNVLAIYTFDDEGHRQFTDYWCDICAFPMYQIQPCECCQGEVRLRFQRQELPDYILKTATGNETDTITSD